MNKIPRFLAGAFPQEGVGSWSLEGSRARALAGHAAPGAIHRRAPRPPPARPQPRRALGGARTGARDCRARRRHDPTPGARAEGVCRGPALAPPSAGPPRRPVTGAAAAGAGGAAGRAGPLSALPRASEDLRRRPSAAPAAARTDLGSPRRLRPPRARRASFLPAGGAPARPSRPVPAPASETPAPVPATAPWTEGPVIGLKEPRRR